ncbi:MAG: hypothetical protein COV48_01840, partial [Elusimicrobia bacterium CG11_big_fil_rev_8_21_14_0_20_64_6]
LLGSWGTYALLLEVTLKLHARPVEIRPDAASIGPRPLSPWALKVRKAFDPEGRMNPGLVDS